MKAFIASFVKGQVLLLAPQPILLVLIIFNKVSLYFGAPVIVSLAVLWGWFDYSGKAQRRGASVLKKLERLVVDFGWLNFQQGGGGGNELRASQLDTASAGQQSLVDDGLPGSETKVRALEVDPGFKTGTEVSETKQSPP